ncbi:MAG: Cof-type HAD-IIB family hydrolase [Bacteroidaceae bacterium]|nr:Cof-type HAD-IIB family hydrolase [Bacteroidaceae bacterium]
MNFKLLVLDIDGTLLNSNREMSERTIKTLKKVQQNGVRVALATGRPTYGVLPYAKAIDLDFNDGYIISYNGAKVLEASTGKVIFERTIDPQLIPYLEKQAIRSGCALAYYENDEVVATDTDNPHLVDEAQMNNMTLRHVNSISEALENLGEEKETWPTEVIIVNDDEQVLAGMEEHLQRHMNGVIDTIRSNPYYLEVVGYQVGKSYAMSALVQKLGISMNEVLAFGDGRADINMLQMAGTGIAMGNAPEEVKRCADYTTLSNDEDGAALAIARAFEEEQDKPEDDQEVPVDVLNAQNRNTLMGALGMQYTFASPHRVEATMPVDGRTRQPFGILAGGASLALAETLAGLGSMIACKPGEMAVGMQVSGNHVSSAHDGDTVRGVAVPVHLGRSSHVWNVQIFTSTGKLVSSVTVTNSIMSKR